MRTLLALAAASLLLTGTSLAEPQYRMSKPGATYASFSHDQRICEHASTGMTWFHGHGSLIGMHGGSGGVRIQRQPNVFLRCMAQRGYRLDPHGFRTGPLWQFASL